MIISIFYIFWGEIKLCYWMHFYNCVVNMTCLKQQAQCVLPAYLIRTKEYDKQPKTHHKPQTLIRCIKTWQGINNLELLVKTTLQQLLHAAMVAHSLLRNA